MRLRKQSPTGDFQFGNNQFDYWNNQADGVAQLIKTRLGLWTGEWFLDTTDGTPWGQVIGSVNNANYQLLIKERILDTEGVYELSNYAVNLDNDTRQSSITASILTNYSTAVISLTQQIPV